MKILNIKILLGYLSYEAYDKRWAYRVKFIHKYEIKDLILAYISEKDMDEIMCRNKLYIKNVEEIIGNFFNIEMKEMLIVNKKKISKSLLRECIINRRRPYKLKKSKLEKIIKDYLDKKPR